MPQPYSKETQSILDDFLQSLDRGGEIDPDFFADLRQMMEDGKLDDRAQIRQAIAALEAKAHDLYH